MRKKVIVIGPGYMGKKHLESYLKNDLVEVVGLVCKKKDSQKRLFEEYGIETFLNLDEAIYKKKPEIASICTPTETHFNLAKKCLKKGLDILVEKPLTENIKEAINLKNIAKKEKKIILCAHTEIFNPSIISLLKTIEKSKKGKIKTIILKKFGKDISPKQDIEKFESSKNQIYNRLIHLIYLINAIKPGLPSEISTKEIEIGLNKEKIKAGFKINGTKIVLISEYNEKNLEKKIYLGFEKGNLQYILKDSKEEIFLDKQKVEITNSNSKAIDNLIGFFLNCIEEKNEKKEEVYVNHAIETMIISKALINKKNLDLKKNNQTLVIRPSLKCNQNCKFCNVKFEENFKEKKIEEIYALLIETLPKEIVITGGEPTIWKEIFSIMRISTLMGVEKIGIQTNGILCSYKKFSKKLKENGVTDAMVSLHSHEEKTSDFLTSAPGTWKKTIEGIRNLLSVGIRTRICYVINEKNYEKLPEFILYTTKKFPLLGGIDLLLDQHRGMGKYNPNLLPKLSKIEPYLTKARRIAKQKNIELKNSFSIPLCYWEDISQSHEYSLLYNNENKIQINNLKKDKIKRKNCKKCIYDKFCLGVWKGYEQIHGLKELNPIKKT